MYLSGQGLNNVPIVCDKPRILVDYYFTHYNQKIDFFTYVIKDF